MFNQLGLDVSAVGNHELDQGYDDLVNRVMAPYDADTNPHGGAAWHYIAANIDEPGGADEIAPSWTTDVGGVTVGFVGAVTEHLPELVSPAGIEGLQVTDIVDATNQEAAALKSAGADVVVLLVHEGAPNTDCATMDDDPQSDFGSIIDGVSGDVDAIVSGHTHLDYSCSFPVPAWAADPGHPVKERPVVSAGQYGAYLNKLDFTVDPATGVVQAVTQENLDINAGDYQPDADVQAIVDQAEADAEGPGSVELGQIGAPFRRATKADGSENRGGESTLGNFVAEVQRWATRSAAAGAAQIAFMNPGGLREDMAGNADGGYPAPVTYRQAAAVQPFANTLVNMTLTGAQIRQVLEEQWQPEGASRPFLRLGTSNGFKYTADPDAAPGHHITTMWLRGHRITPDETYSVTANSFLAAGGDNFTTLADGTAVRDTGKTDLQAMVDYLGPRRRPPGLADLEAARHRPALAHRRRGAPRLAEGADRRVLLGVHRGGRPARHPHPGAGRQADDRPVRRRQHPGPARGPALGVRRDGHGGGRGEVPARQAAHGHHAAGREPHRHRRAGADPHQAALTRPRHLTSRKASHVPDVSGVAASAGGCRRPRRGGDGPRNAAHRPCERGQHRPRHQRGVRRRRQLRRDLHQRLRRALQPHVGADQRRRPVRPVPQQRQHVRGHRRDRAQRQRPGGRPLPRAGGAGRRRQHAAAGPGRHRHHRDERHGVHRVARRGHRPAEPERRRLDDA